MSDSSSDSDVNCNDSEFNFIPSNYQPIEAEIEASESQEDVEALDDVLAYADEPLADSEWTREYERQQAEKNKRLESLKDRLSGKESITNWCSCCKCSIEFLQNSNECYCCKDIQQCTEALEDELVIRETHTPPECITLHPAFRTICLDPWSLRLSAGKYRTIDKKTYRQTGSEEAFMRSVAYREFSHLVHGRIGKNRIPLPACAYHAIRSTFQPKDNNECFTGFQDDEMEV